MANEENLKPSEYKFTQEEAKKGGIASGKARREKAILRQIAEEILNGSFKDKKCKEVTGREIVKIGLLSNINDPKSKNWGKAMDLLMKLTDAETPQLNVTFDNSFIEALNSKAQEVWEDESE
jgi:DNA-binding ferritin-like protein (Dps family)